MQVIKHQYIRPQSSPPSARKAPAVAKGKTVKEKDNIAASKEKWATSGWPVAAASDAAAAKIKTGKAKRQSDKSRQRAVFAGTNAETKNSQQTKHHAPQSHRRRQSPQRRCGAAKQQADTISQRCAGIKPMRGGFAKGDCD